MPKKKGRRIWLSSDSDSDEDELVECSCRDEFVETSGGASSRDDDGENAPPTCSLQSNRELFDKFLQCAQLRWNIEQIKDLDISTSSIDPLASIELSSEQADDDMIAFYTAKLERLLKKLKKGKNTGKTERKILSTLKEIYENISMTPNMFKISLQPVTLKLEKVTEDPQVTEFVRLIEEKLLGLGLSKAGNKECHDAQELGDGVNVIQVIPLKERMSVAAKAFREFNVKVFGGLLPSNLEITWNPRLLSTAGTTSMRRNKDNRREASVELSTKVCDSTKRIRETLAHELCHVACWVIDGVQKPAHGRLFKAYGAKVTSTYPGIRVSTCHNYDIRYKYEYRCVSCDWKIGRHSKSVEVESARCGACRGFLRLVKLNADGTAAKRSSRYHQFQAAMHKKLAQRGSHLSLAEKSAFISKRWVEEKTSWGIVDLT